MHVVVKRILVVDDEEDLCEILQYNLVNEGFYIEIAHSAEEAIKRPLETFDLILLDVMMGPVSGFKFADKLRNELKLASSIIFISAKNNENDILTGFSLGADDYISKPFSINELTARIKAVLRRASAEIQVSRKIISYGGIELDIAQKSLLVNDERVALSGKECEALRLFLENRGEVFSREYLLDKLWGSDRLVKERIVDVIIAKLRTRLGEYGRCLRNRTGCGYYFEF